LAARCDQGISWAVNTSEAALVRAKREKRIRRAFIVAPWYVMPNQQKAVESI
jgi:hypothetical protein